VTSAPLRLSRWLLAGIATATVIAIAILWPGEDRPSLAGPVGDSEAAEVISVSQIACPPPAPGECVSTDIELTSGPDEGTTQTMQLGLAGEEVADLGVGDEIRVLRAEAPETGAVTYSFADFERRSTLLWLALAFAVLVIAFGRLRGALSLVGLGLSLAIIVVFIVPAILSGESPFAVAVAGALAVMLVTIPLAHGIGGKSVAAMLGTTASLLLTAGLALGATELAHLTGLSSEEAILLDVSGAAISLQGLLVAGMVIGALGVLDDVTVSQASTVFALRAANPVQGFGELLGGAMRVGRDHVSATVNTLVLAYVGSALPVLLVFGASDVSLGLVSNTELVAREIVATLVGSIGLIAAVPITTALAAWLARATPADDLAAEAEPAHAH
jgi:uncharacterized membrane protein